MSIEIHLIHVVFFLSFRLFDRAADNVLFDEATEKEDMSIKERNDGIKNVPQNYLAVPETVTCCQTLIQLLHEAEIMVWRHF